jgi:excisionase family DNA binding protein
LESNIVKPRLKDYPDVLDVPQLSEFLGVSKKTVYSLLKEKEITSVKVGRSYKVPKIYLMKFLKLTGQG